MLLEVNQKQHIVVGLPTCVVGGKPTTTCVVGLPTCVVGDLPTYTTQNTSNTAKQQSGRSSTYHFTPPTCVVGG